MAKDKTKIKDILEELPVTRYDEGTRCFACQGGGYLDIYRIIPRDLINLDADEIEMDCFRWAKFHKTYGEDVEIVTMLFPCDTGLQQKYWKRKRKENQNPVYDSMLERKISELRYRERHTSTKEFFMVLFYPSKEEMTDAINTVEGTLGIRKKENSELGMLEELPKNKKKKVLFKLGNKNSMIFSGEEKNEYKERNIRGKTTKETPYDVQLLSEISPAGGIRHYETYSRTGTGYEACIHIWDFPSSLNDFWLTKACSQASTITSISIHTKDQVEVKRNLNKSIQEQNSRKRFAKEYKDYYDAEVREEEMKALFDEINSMGEVMKSISIRIFAVGKTREELEASVGSIIKSLEADSYRAAVFLNESSREWRSVYLPATEQEKAPHALPGFPLKATLLAAGNAFHFSSLEDTCGDFLGETKCGGNILFDEFTRNATRVNGSAILVGNQRFGKSSLLKLRLKTRALLGDYIRVMDITGEFSPLIRSLGGRVLNMDGTDGMINLLEIFKSGTTDHTSYARHLSKLKSAYHFLNHQADVDEVTAFLEMVGTLYEKWNLLPGVKEHQITGLASKNYPTFSDLLQVIDKEIEAMIQRSYTEQEKILVQKSLLNLDQVRKQIQRLVNPHGGLSHLFNGHTTVSKMSDVKVVSYNLTQVKDLDPEIFDLQLFNIMSLSWDDAVTNGSIMKDLWQSGKILLEDVIHTMIVIDESHRWVNARKTFALELLGIYLREAPKYFGNLWLASQNIRDYTPEGSEAKEIDKLKTIFELTQYKFIFRQDSNTLPIIDKVFDNVLTYSQRAKIPRLQRGETILCISGDTNLEFKVYLSKQDEKLFAGGA